MTIREQEFNARIVLLELRESDYIERLRELENKVNFLMGQIAEETNQ